MTPKSETDPSRLGIAGLGHMGSPILRRLIAAGYKVACLDRDPGAAAAAVADGGRVVGSPEELARESDVVLTCLPTPAAVEAVTIGSGGLSSAPGGFMVVDLSTTGPRVSRAIADHLARRDVAFVDSPVSGGVRGAAAGRLAVMAAGAPAAIDTVAPVLGQLGRVVVVGHTPGMGQVMKLVNNYLSAVALAASSEALVLATRSGLDPRTVLDVLNSGSGRNSATEDKFPQAILSGSFDAGFAMELMCKDLRLFETMAAEADVSLPVVPTLIGFWQSALQELGGAADFTEIVRVLEREADVEVRAPRAT
ncbi:NAD(P)-dependent oxidoreductase [Pseudonocardia kujensis]|uniref:NAD(P)-dependent oxidoreductase n=1 Tax=Pseudonocardia kujensis TaxID=1128675 RepID=UPI001E50B269|nr:NAD(P)-dependent oxidoreductase [Pseudonocardia kujensis]MCE0764084.1 NAD(P)-dependent oxidoreductase [Pseudonocardia kujensis]